MKGYCGPGSKKKPSLAARQKAAVRKVKRKYMGGAK